MAGGAAVQDKQIALLQNFAGAGSHRDGNTRG